MKRINAGLLLALFFVLAGVFLLLMNLGVLGDWADAAWGGLFVAVGLIFLFWFASDRLHRLEAVAGTTLVSSGAVILLQWQNVALGSWKLGIVLLGIAAGFWLVAIVRPEDWWAVLPAGVLTVQGLLIGLAPEAFEALFLIGLGAVFGLIYLLRRTKGDARWALIPALALALFGLVQWLSVNESSALLLKLWPILLIAAGVLIGYLAFARGKPAQKAPAPAAPVEAATPVAPGASRTEKLPDVPASSSGNVDIYDLIKNQPKE